MWQLSCFWRLNHIPLCLYYTVLIYLSVERLCYFHLLATVNNASMNMGYKYLFQFLVLNILGVFPGLKLTGSMLTLCLFLRSPYCFLQLWLYFTIWHILLYAFIWQSNASYGWIYLILLIYSPVGGHFHCFYLGLLRTVLLWILVYNIWTYVLNSLYVCLGVELPKHMIVTFLYFWKMLKFCTH